MPDRLDELAERFGIADGYVSEKGDWVTTPSETKAKVLEAMGVPVGRHATAPPRSRAAGRSRMSRHCRASAYWPPFLVDHRAWGLSVQAYALRSSRNWGIGDFEDLARLAEFAAGLGADFVGVSPLHALFFADPSRISPYSPSTRDFLNPLLIAPDRVPGYADLPERAELEAELPTLRETELIDYPAVHRVKRPRSRSPVRPFRGERERQRAKDAFEQFCHEHGTALEGHALFEALSEHFVAEGGNAAWSTWPEELSRPGQSRRARLRARRQAPHRLSRLAAMGRRHPTRRRASARRAAGMRIGLYLDLAVGISPDGSRSWLNGPAIARHAPDRLPARSLQRRRPGLGPRALLAGRARRRALRAVPLGAAVEHAPCRRAAHRSRHGPAAALLDSRRQHRHRRRLCGLSLPRASGGRGRGILDLPDHRHRRGSRHGSSGIYRHDGPGWPSELPGLLLHRAGRRLDAAACVPARGPGLRLDPRSADPERLVGRQRHRLAREDGPRHGDERP